MSLFNLTEEAESFTTRSTRVRLTKEGSIFLSNYARTVSSYPNKTEKLAILASLRAIPGNETFTFEKLTNWFARHRKPSRDLHAPVLLDDETILFPKLTPTHLQQIRVLYKKRTDPSEGIIAFWADRINADKAEITAWIQYQQEKARENGVAPGSESPDTPLRQLVADAVHDSASASLSPSIFEFPRTHLPTPSKSLSPSLETRMPSLPPIAVKVEEPRQCLSPVSSLDTLSVLKPKSAVSYMHSNEPLPPLSTLHHILPQQAKPPPVAISVSNAILRIGGKPCQRDSNTTFAVTIRDSLRPDAIPSEKPPRTADEFAEKFQGVENMIDVFMKKYDSGQLAKLGWDSSLSKAAS